MKNTTGMDLAKDKIAMQRLRDAAEQAKKELSTATSTNINLQYLSMGENGPIHLDETLSRAQFEAMTSDLLERCKAPSTGDRRRRDRSPRSTTSSSSVAAPVCRP